MHLRPQRQASPHILSWERHLPHALAAPCRTSGWCSHLLWSCLLWDWISYRDEHKGHWKEMFKYLPVKYAIKICYSDKNALRFLFTQGIPDHLISVFITKFSTYLILTVSVSSTILLLTSRRIIVLLLFPFSAQNWTRRSPLLTINGSLHLCKYWESSVWQCWYTIINCCK